MAARDVQAELTRECARVDVGRAGGRVVTFCNYWLVANELHIHVIATHPDYRGRGVARQILDHVLAARR